MAPDALQAHLRGTLAQLTALIEQRRADLPCERPADLAEQVLQRLLQAAEASVASGDASDDSFANVMRVTSSARGAIDREFGSSRASQPRLAADDPLAGAMHAEGRHQFSEWIRPWRELREAHFALLCDARGALGSDAKIAAAVGPDVGMLASAEDQLYPRSKPLARHAGQHRVHPSMQQQLAERSEEEHLRYQQPVDRQARAQQPGVQLEVEHLVRRRPGEREAPYHQNEMHFCHQELQPMQLPYQGHQPQDHRPIPARSEEHGCIPQEQRGEHGTLAPRQSEERHHHIHELKEHTPVLQQPHQLHPHLQQPRHPQPRRQDCPQRNKCSLQQQPMSPESSPYRFQQEPISASSNMREGHLPSHQPLGEGRDPHVCVDDQHVSNEQPDKWRISQGQSEEKLPTYQENPTQKIPTEHPPCQPPEEGYPISRRAEGQPFLHRPPKSEHPVQQPSEGQHHLLQQQQEEHRDRLLHEEQHQQAERADPPRNLHEEERLDFGEHTEAHQRQREERRPACAQSKEEQLLWSRPEEHRLQEHERRYPPRPQAELQSPLFLESEEQTLREPDHDHPQPATQDSRRLQAEVHAPPSEEQHAQEQHEGQHCLRPSAGEQQLPSKPRVLSSLPSNASLEPHPQSARSSTTSSLCCSEPEHPDPCQLLLRPPPVPAPLQPDATPSVARCDVASHNTPVRRICGKLNLPAATEGSRRCRCSPIPSADSANGVDGRGKPCAWRDSVARRLWSEAREDEPLGSRLGVEARASLEEHASAAAAARGSAADCAATIRQKERPRARLSQAVDARVRGGCAGAQARASPCETEGTEPRSNSGTAPPVEPRDCVAAELALVRQELREAKGAMRRRMAGRLGEASSTHTIGGEATPRMHAEESELRRSCELAVLRFSFTELDLSNFGPNTLRDSATGELRDCIRHRLHRQTKE